MKNKWRVASGEWREKPPIPTNPFSVGRKAELMAIAACIVIGILSHQRAHATFTFDDIEFWVGTGDNRAALVIDWSENDPAPPALAWGFRWSGAATGRDMLQAIVAADDRLYVKFNDRGNADPTHVNPTIVYGLGYDNDDDGVFGISDGSTFDGAGKSFGGPPFFGANATDPGDYYREGWTFGFWHYGVETPDGSNPYAGGSWFDTEDGMHTRDLVDGSWDSWAFEGSTSPPFVAFAENPTPAPPPFPPGDFNQDGEVDDTDYSVWSGTFGSTTQLAADANHNGIVDAADYVRWREHRSQPATFTSSNVIAQVPEPIPISMLLPVLCFRVAVRRNR